MSSPANDPVLAALVEEIVRQVIARLKGEALPGVPRAKPFLFVLTGAAHGHDAALDLVRSACARAPVEVFAASCYAERHGVGGLGALGEGCTVRHEFPSGEFAAAFARVAGIAFLLPRFSTMARAARGLAEGGSSLLLQEALMHGVPVFSAGGDFHPDAWPATAPLPMKRGADSIGEAAARDLAVLQGWGLVHRREPAELLGLILDKWNLPRGAATAIPPGAQSESLVKTLSGFVTVNDLRALQSQGVRHVRVAPGVRITDAAIEEMERLSMTMEES